MQIELNKKYLSSLMANTDLVAGGNFDYLLYKNCLEFFEDGQVRLTKKIIEAFDEGDISYLENYQMTGRYSLNNKGYLVFTFEELSLEYTGKPTTKNPSIIPFYVLNRSSLTSGSQVYQLENSDS